MTVTPQSASASAAGHLVGGGNVSVGWSIPHTPASGLTNITFPLTVNRATAHEAGVYFAQQYSFAHGAGYTGLQPRSNSGGRERLHGVFSTFTAGASTTDANCHLGADNGPGVSCGVDFDGVYGHRYAITVTRTGTDTWTGKATDTVTGASTHIGTYSQPAGSGNIQGSQGGFVEYYAGVPSCSTMPRADAVFGGPTTTDAGGLSGGTKANYEYGDCVGRSNYHAVNGGTGTHVTRGYVSGSGSRVTSRTTPPPSPSPAPHTSPNSVGPAPQSKGSVTVSPGHGLAETGSGPAAQIAGAAAGLLAVGAGALWATRRRSRLRHTSNG
ncbi:hypothetical protein GCM10010211_08530 [Streptomyces albospinus]|uniref:Uncharacterized protein n=1 Tax=Streptomyces albospinus TaxID=285515 RepID=A0ABQ2UQQ4_9ACTN|nr:hypothetical protein GCM10010211_08530 [Streptomyces albospinus]